VEAKRLSREAKAALKALHPDAVGGAPDLYLYFLHVCLGWLGQEDLLAFVLPNKLLVNANAQRLRERLLAEGRVQRLWFATQAHLFPGAAVYPVVLFATGKRQGWSGTVETHRITRAEGQELAQGEPVRIDAEQYRSTSARAFFPPPEAPVLRNALRRLLLREDGAPRLAELLEIRWSVSFHRSGLRERYVTPEAPTSPHARRFLGGGPFSGNGEVVRYALSWGGWWIDYDEERLRREGNAVPKVSLFEQPKIVLCQNGRTLRAAYDEEGFVLKDTFLCGIPRRPEHPLCRHPQALVGLLCSCAIHFFYAHVYYGGHVNGGYLHYLRSFLVDLPTGAWTGTQAAEVSLLVEQRAVAPADQRLPLEEAIEGRIGEGLGLTPVEAEAIREWAEDDANWRARERVRGPRR
jgi:hypothetical protein